MEIEASAYFVGHACEGVIGLEEESIGVIAFDGMADEANACMEGEEGIDGETDIAHELIDGFFHIGAFNARDLRIIVVSG